MKTRARFVLPVAVALLIALPPVVSAQQSITDGVQLWSRHCGRCHNFRPAEERSDQDWAIILSHMRVRANLTKSDAQAILAFLQSSNGTGESMTAAPSSAPSDAVRAPADPGAPGNLDWSLAMMILRARWTVPEVP